MFKVKCNVTKILHFFTFCPLKHLIYPKRVLKLEIKRTASTRAIKLQLARSSTMAAEPYACASPVQRSTAKTYSAVKTLARIRQNAWSGTLTHTLFPWRPTAVRNRNARMVRIWTTAGMLQTQLIAHVLSNQMARVPLRVCALTITSAFLRNCCHVENGVYATMVTFGAKICALKWAMSPPLDCHVRQQWPSEDTCREISAAFTGNVVMSFTKEHVSYLFFSVLVICA